MASGLGQRSLWLVVAAPNGRSYPQPRFDVSDDGSFNALAYFGDATGGAGLAFALEVVAASPAAAQTFSDYLSSAQNNGLGALPTGAELLTTVRVIRSA